MSTYIDCPEQIECNWDEDVVRFRFPEHPLNYELLECLLTALKKATSDSQVRCFSLELSGKHVLPDELGSLPEAYQHRAPSGAHGEAPILEQAVLKAMFEFKKPLVAFMSGPCESQVLDLAAFCDIRIASDSSILRDPRVANGESASTGITYLLPKLIGLSQAMRVLLLGDTVAAEEAHRMHFVHKVVADEDFQNEIVSLSRQLASMATRAWEVHKLQVQGQLHLDFDSAMIHSLGIRQTHVIQDQKEGIQAWRERREPRFSGK